MSMLLSVILLIIVLLITTTREPFTEFFGFSGYKKPVGTVRFDDAKPNLAGYSQAEADVNNNMMEEFVLQANKEIGKRTGLCTYIIETTSVKKYTKDNSSIYECMFMTVKDSGFAFGFSVVATYEITGDTIKLISLRSQPLDVESVSNMDPFVGGQPGQEFLKYELVKEKTVPTIGELEKAKNKLQ
jgi:hypothetical protein